MSEIQRETKLCKKCKTEIDKKAKVCPQCRSKQGIGVLGWVGIVFLALIVIGAASGGENNPPVAASPVTPAASEQPAEQATVPEAPAPVEDLSIKAAMYKIGTDMPAGEYVLIGNSGGAYFQLSKDSTGTLDSIIANDLFSNRAYITVSDGQYFEFKNAKAYPTASAPAVEPVNGTLEEGMYRVGLDVPAGEYKVTAPGDGYVEVSKNSSHTLDSIVSNDLFSGEKYVSFKDGQYIKLRGASLILPQ